MGSESKQLEKEISEKKKLGGIPQKIHIGKDWSPE